MQWMLMPLRRYAEFGGRSRPQEFWMFVLFQLIIYIVLTIVTVAIGLGAAGMSSLSNTPSAGMAGMMGAFAALGIFALFYVLVGLGFFIPNLAVATRRLHDTNRSGWWQMLYWGPWLLGIALSLANIGAATSGTPSSGLTLGSGLMSLLQLLGLLVLIVFYCLPGTPGMNQYGPDPMMRDVGAVFS